MKVIGFDPSITIKSAWKLSADVEQALSVDELFSQSDFVSFHVPLSLHNFSYPLPPQFLDY
jgi:D-3-phosphoglycerate dehydrogenase